MFNIAHIGLDRFEIDPQHPSVPAVCNKWTSLPARAVIELIRARQQRTAGRRACRFQPACSEYLIAAIARQGLVVGGTKGVIRFGRCHLTPGIRGRDAGDVHD